MSGVVTAIVAGVSWCFCRATASLCGAWCGNDKPSSVAPSATSGRKRSVLLLAFSVAVSLAFQYALGPNYGKLRLEYLVEAWSSGCEHDNQELVQICAGNSGVYRAQGAAFLFFFLFAIAAKCRPTANREAWPAKYVLYIFLCIGTVFIPNRPVFVPLFVNIARAGSVIFVVLQQIILIDIAYNWNESWLENSEKAERDEGAGSGKKWLAAILVSCGVLYGASLAGIVVMYIQFRGCPTNDAFISITLAMSLICTAAQMLNRTETGSLLTSACMAIYSTYLCGAAVSKNPDAECNPHLGDESIWSVVIGLLFAFVSLLWAGWSYTADSRLGGGDGSEAEDNDGEQQIEKPVGGLVVGNGDADDSSPNSETALVDKTGEAPTSFGNTWKLNAVMMLVCCWITMTLTGWGSIENRGSISNPAAGQVSMWLLVASQWLALLLYLWTLLAPTLMPGRDFS